MKGLRNELVASHYLQNPDKLETEEDQTLSAKMIHRHDHPCKMSCKMSCKMTCKMTSLGREHSRASVGDMD